MRGSWAEKACRAWQAGGITRRVIRSSIAEHRAIGVARSRVGTSRPSIAPQPTEFRVIKHVECLGPKFKVLALRDRKVFEQSHIEICPPGIVQNVPSGVAKSKSSRRNKRGGVIEKRSKTRVRSVLNASFGLPTTSGYEPSVRLPRLSI